MWSHLSNILFPLLWYIFSPPAPSGMFSQVVSGKSPSIVFCLHHLPKIVLHSSISSLVFLLTLYLICLLSSHLPSDFAYHSAPMIIVVASPLLSRFFCCTFNFCPLLLLFHPPPPSHFLLLIAGAIFGVLLASFSSSCHIFMKKILKLWSSATLLCIHGNIWCPGRSWDQEKPVCVNVTCLKISLKDPATKDWHITTFESGTASRSLAPRLAFFASGHCFMWIHWRFCVQPWSNKSSGDTVFLPDFLD